MLVLNVRALLQVLMLLIYLYSVIKTGAENMLAIRLPAEVENRTMVNKTMLRIFTRNTKVAGRGGWRSVYRISHLRLWNQGES